MIIEKKGNIFTTKAQTIVNTINCVGVMGAGIAYEFRLRHTDMYEKYVSLCEEKKIDIGKLWMYKTDANIILTFPTKYHWKYPTKEEYLHLGLQKFLDTYKQKGIISVAFPLLGASHGGLSEEKSLSIMMKYLSKCDIDIEIWHFDPSAKDDLFDQFMELLQENDLQVLKKDTKIRIDILEKIVNASQNPKINSISGLLRIKGVGDKSLQKLFNFVMKRDKEPTLFDYLT